MNSARTPHPTALPPLHAADWQTRYYSTRSGGDFSDAVVVGNSLIFLLTDIAGDRNRAHIIAAEVQEILRRRGPALFGAPGANMTDALAALAHEINLAILSSAGAVCFSPTFLACFDMSLALMAYINAGGAPAVFRDSDGTRLLGNVTMPLGLFSHLTFEPSVQAFEPGALLLLVTKGIVDSQHGHEHFGVERVSRILQSFPGGPAIKLAEGVVQKAHRFRRRPWYSRLGLPFTKPERVEDLTATVLQRPA